MKTLSPEALRRLQFGGLVDVVSNINKKIGQQALAAAGKVAESPLMVPFELEEKYVSRPLASLLTPVAAPFLSPEQEERFKQVASMLFAPSNLALSATGVGLGLKGARALRYARAARTGRRSAAATAMQQTAQAGKRQATNVAEYNTWESNLRRDVRRDVGRARVEEAATDRLVRRTANREAGGRYADDFEPVDDVRSSADVGEEGAGALSRASDATVRRVFRRDRQRWMDAGEEMMVQSDAVDDYGGDRTLAALDLIETFDTADEATEWIRTQNLGEEGLAIGADIGPVEAMPDVEDALRAQSTERRTLGREQLMAGEAHGAGVGMDDVRAAMEQRWPGPVERRGGAEALSDETVRQALRSHQGEDLMQRALGIADDRLWSRTAPRRAAAFGEDAMPSAQTLEAPKLPEEFVQTGEVHTSQSNTAVIFVPKKAKGKMSIHRTTRQPDVWEATITGAGRGKASEFSGLGVALEWLKLAKPLKRFREMNPQATIVAAPISDGSFAMGAPKTMAKYGNIDSIDKAMVALRDPELMHYIPEYGKKVNPEWRSVIYQGAGFEVLDAGRGADLILPNSKKGLKFLVDGGEVVANDLVRRLALGGLITNPVSTISKFLQKDQPGGGALVEAGRQVEKAMVWEQEKIGKPIVQGLLYPFSPVLPDAIERGIVGVGSAFFTPSSLAFFLLPVGRGVTVGRVLSRIGGQAAAGQLTGAQAATQSRLALRQLFAPSTRQAAQVMIARKTGAPLHAVIEESIQNPKLSKVIFGIEERMKSMKKAGPRRWQSEIREMAADDMNFMEELIFADLPAKATPAQAKAYFQNHAWWSNLMRGDGIDPALLVDNVGLTARAWNSFKAVPFLGAALEHGTALLQPVAMVSAPVRRMWLTAATHAPGWNWQAKSSRDAVAIVLESSFGKPAVGGEIIQGLKYTGPVSRTKDAALKQVVGRLVDVMEHPKYYDLSKYQRDTIKRAQRMFDLDRAEATALGVSMGQVNTGYFPHRISVEGLTPGGAEKLSEFFARQNNQPRFASLFRKRRYNWDEFVKRADEINQLAASEGFTVTGSGVETSIVRLADWRFGNAARKKTEQLFYHLLARDPETTGLVFRPSRLGPGLREALTKEGLPFEEVAATLKEAGMPQLAQAAGRRVQVTAKELALRPPTGLVDPKVAQMAKEANALMTGSLRRELGIETTVSKGLDYMRAVLLSHDLSPIGLVQGMRVFAADPIAYFSQIGEAATWMMTKNGKRVWGIQNLPNVQFWTRRGLTLGNVLDIRPEMLQRWGPTVFGTKVAPFAPAGWLNRQLMDVVQVAKLRIANTMLGAMTIAQREGQVAELIEGLPWAKKAKTKLGPTWQDSSYDEIAEAISDGLNNAIGPINFTAVNKEGVASFGERFMVLTPSWTRGNIGQIVNAAKVGPKGVIARWLLMNQLATGALLASKISMAVSGQMPSFDPRKSDFLSVRLPWGRFNIMPSMPVYRLPARVLFGKDDFNDVESRWAEFLRFGETRMGQVPRLLIDTQQGQDFLGRKIDNKALFVAKELLPILGQEVIETRQEGGVSGGELAQRLSMEFLGSVVIPKTPFRLERERVEQLTGEAYDDVDMATLRRLRAEDDTLKELRKRQQKYRADRGGAVNQFFNILSERTEEMQTAITAYLDHTPQDKPGFMAEFAAISSEELSSRAVAAEEAKKSLGITDKDLESTPRTQVRDVLAIEYWSVRPVLEHCRISDDPEACENEAWTLFRDQRQEVLDKAPDDATREYMVEEFAATRYAGNPVAEDLERRRVVAQRASSEFFETSPYLLPNGQEMPQEMLDELFSFRNEFNALMIQVGRAVREVGGPAENLPSGSRRKILSAILAQTTDPLRRNAIAFQLLWESSTFREFLRNRRRDEMLIANPDMIKFWPDIFGRFVKRSEIIDRLGDDPEILRIASGQVG